MKITGIVMILQLAFLFSCTSNSGDAEIVFEKDGEAVLYFSEQLHDFGKISEGEKVACVFRFENKGDADLLIKSAITSCGCTVPEFPKEPVKAGVSGVVEVVFDSSFRDGLQNKTITIRSNAKKPVVILRITADVITNN